MRKACLRLRLDARTAVRCNAPGAKRGGGLPDCTAPLRVGFGVAVRQSWLTEAMRACPPPVWDRLGHAPSEGTAMSGLAVRAFSPPVFRWCGLRYSAAMPVSPAFPAGGGV